MSIGGNSREESSSSSSDRFAENMNFGSDFTAGKGGGTTGGQSWQEQGVYGAQEPYLQRMYSRGFNEMDRTTGAIKNFNRNNPYTQNVNKSMRSLGKMSDPQALIDAQTGSLKAGLQETFAEGLNEIGADASMMGAFGGSRHGLREAALGGELADAYTQGYGDIVANARNQSMQANQLRGGLAGQGQQMGLQGRMAQMAPLQQYAGMIGGPTVLGQGGSTNFGQNFTSSIGQGLNLGFGYDDARAKTKGSGESGGFGFGLK